MSRDMTSINSCLVVQAENVGLTHGGGQRSWLIFKTLQDMGPVTVIILGQVSEDAASCFEGARAVQIWPQFGCPAKGHSSLARFAAFLARSFSPSRTYAMNPALNARLRAVMRRDDIDLAMFRLFRTFAVSGLDSDPAEAPRMIVDIDDRDDQKARTRMKALAGALLTRLVFDPLAIAPLRKLMAARLRAAAQAWFVSDADRSPAFGVPTELVENAPLHPPADRVRAGPSTSRRMLFVGPSYFPPNRHGMAWFLRECWPRIAAQAPDARLAIAGDGDWQTLAARAPAADRIDVLGRVDDLPAEYEASRFTICPIEEGGGSKIKLIESCAYGRPVVATPHSCRGYAEPLARELAVGASAEEFSQQCLRLLDDDALVSARGQRLMRAQQRFHSADATRQRMAASIREALGLAAVPLARAA